VRSAGTLKQFSISTAREAAEESSPRSLANLRLSVAVGFETPVLRPKPIKGEPAQGKDSQFLAVVGNLVGGEAWIAWVLFVCLFANQNPDPLAKKRLFFSLRLCQILVKRRRY